MGTNDLYKINLLPAEIIQQRKYEAWYPWIVSITAILVMVLGLLFAWSSLVLDGQMTELNGIEQEVTATQKQADSLKSYEAEAKDHKFRETIVTKALKNRMDPYLLAVTVTKYIPANVWLTNITFSETEGFTLQGLLQDVGTNPETRDWRGVAQCVDDLESSALLRKVWLTTGNMADVYVDPDVDAAATTTTGGDTAAVPFPDLFSITADSKITLNTVKDKGTWSSVLLAATEGK